MANVTTTWLWSVIAFQLRASQPWLLVKILPGGLSKIPMLRPYSKPIKWECLGVGPWHCFAVFWHWYFWKHADDLNRWPGMRIAPLTYWFSNLAAHWNCLEVPGSPHPNHGHGCNWCGMWPGLQARICKSCSVVQTYSKALKPLLQAHPPTASNRAHFTLKRKSIVISRWATQPVRNIFILLADLRRLRITEVGVTPENSHCAGERWRKCNSVSLHIKPFDTKGPATCTTSQASLIPDCLCDPCGLGWVATPPRKHSEHITDNKQIWLMSSIIVNFWVIAYGISLPSPFILCSK